MLEETNDNLSRNENDTDGNGENTSQETQITKTQSDNIVGETIATTESENIDIASNENIVDEIELETEEVFTNEVVETVNLEQESVIETATIDAVEAISNQNAAESEDETIKSYHEIEVLDYDSMSMENLIGELEKLTVIEKVMSVKDHVDSVKNAFLQKYHHFIDEKKHAFEAEKLESGSENNEDFHYSFPLKTKFDQLYTNYRDRKNSHFKSLENNLKNNLETRNNLVEELKNLLQSQEKIGSALKSFNDIRDRWKNAGPIPKDKYNHVWNTYHFYVDQFYDILHLDREARDIDFKHNLAQKLNIIARCEELVEMTDVNKAFRELQDLHKIWKEDIGPVSREHREDIWNKFSDFTKQMHDKRELIFEKLREKEVTNLENKNLIISEIAALASEKVNSHSLWAEQVKKVEALRETFFGIGKVPNEVNESTWASFKTAVKDFNLLKNSFYKDLKKDQNDNLIKKQALVAKAKELQENTDFSITTPVMKQIQEEWKTIGHVPRSVSDKLWKQFREACNHYFEKLKVQKNEENAEEVEAFEKKKVYMDIMREFEMTGNHKTDLDAIKLHIETWKSLGRVPAQRRHIEGKFNKILDGLFEKLSLSKKDTEMMRFNNRIEQFSENNDTRKLENEKVFLMRKIEEVQNEIFQLENNIQFFANTRNAKKENSIVLEVRKNIEKHREELVILKDKLKQLRAVKQE